jgi:hypothetical protein
LPWFFSWFRLCSPTFRLPVRRTQTGVLAATQVHAHQKFINTQQDELFTYTYGEEVRFSPNMRVLLRPLTPRLKKWQG